MSFQNCADGARDIEADSSVNVGRSSESLQSANEQPHNEKTSLLKDCGGDENPFTLYSAESEPSESGDLTISSERRLNLENSTTLVYSVNLKVKCYTVLGFKMFSKCVRGFY